MVNGYFEKPDSNVTMSFLLGPFLEPFDKYESIRNMISSPLIRANHLPSSNQSIPSSITTENSILFLPYHPRIDKVGYTFVVRMKLKTRYH